MNDDKADPKPPRMNPYIFTVLLLGFGLWCAWDGWLTRNPEMAEHVVFNRVMSSILIPWAIWDFFKVRKRFKTKNPPKK